MSESIEFQNFLNSLGGRNIYNMNRNVKKLKIVKTRYRDVGKGRKIYQRMITLHAKVDVVTFSVTHANIYTVLCEINSFAVIY